MKRGCWKSKSTLKKFYEKDRINYDNSEKLNYEGVTIFKYAITGIQLITKRITRSLYMMLEIKPNKDRKYLVYIWFYFQHHV